ncbi:hypothetical protein F2P56_037099 [Juglans regia]|uniref:Uncharacterized protein n=1 Tax=Juglans regia TaxID=51240 RepID=A0A833T8I5_JUGRE|nr:hypothetical protein F2P56_037099 [Juglans regia]
MERQCREEELKTRSSKKGQEAEQATLNRSSWSSHALLIMEERHFRGVITLEDVSRVLGDESTIIQKVCGRISNELNSKFSRHDYDKLVAIDSHVDEMMKLLDMESNDVRFVGIHGMGGVGKTTLAEIIYDRVSCQFEGSSFIPCIRENSTTARDLASLQKDLLYMIMQEEIHVCNHLHGSRMISSRMRNKKVFIVLDDVDSEKQLKALAEDRKWFGPGSRVIITCRGSHLLTTHEVNDIHKVEKLETTEALQLFSLSAFKKTHPIEDYKDLSMDFELQKELFLDMACFYEGHKDIFSDMYLERCGHYHIDLDVLVEKSLISKSKYGLLYVHDLLKELGREFAANALKNLDDGTDATKGIALDFCPRTEDQRLNAKAFSKIRKLRYLKFYDSRTSKWRGNPLKHMPTNELRFLEWPGYHSKSFPSSFQPKNLIVLRMPFSRFKQLWKGSMQVLDILKEFNLSYSENLIEIPDLIGVPNLEKINLEGCRSLRELHPYIGSLKKLKALAFEECSSLEKLPDLSSLECLAYLGGQETAITQIPSVNLMAKSIRSFDLQGCKLMRLKSRDPIYHIGSFVEYQKEYMIT